MSSGGDGSRTVLIVALLLVSLGATFLLAWQAQYAVSRHRAAAESVVRDYAALAADEFIRRSAAKVGYEGYYPLIGALTRGLEATGDLERSVPKPEDLGPEDERLRAALPLVKRYFTSLPGSDALSFEEAGPPVEVRSWLSAQLKRPRDETGPFTVVHGSVADEPITVVVQAWTDASRGKRVAGFEVNLEALGAYLAPSIGERSLLPPSLGKGEVTNAAISVSLIDHGGVERFKSGPREFPDFRVKALFGDAYGGVLEGFRVQLSVDPAAAPRLVIGGLPPSRLPVLGGLLLLTAALVATAIREIRRERRLQRLRAEFVANVSHELRTPLAQIRMFAETLLLGRVRSEEESKRSLRIIDREVRRLSHLVENVLQFSRREDGVALSSLGAEPAPLARRVEETIEMFQPLVAETGTRIVARLDPEAEAAFDPDALRQVLLNLLDNAAKYGPRGQEIVVGIESRNGATRLFVEDQGPGIPEGERERVFDRFYRLPRESASATAGTGIGLSVVRDLVTRHGGRTYVETASGGGARFVVELMAPRFEEPRE
jgi:signal transduction histidine kinase